MSSPKRIIALVLVLFLAACGRGATPNATPTRAANDTLLLPGGTEAPTTIATVATSTAIITSVVPTGTPSENAAPATAPANPPVTRGPAVTSPARVSGPTPTPLANQRSSATQTPTTSTPGATVVGAATRTARIANLPSTAPQQAVGTQQDGLVLLNVRAGKNVGFTRIVFDIARPGGAAATVPHARVWTEAGAVIVAIDGIRQDAYGESVGSGEVAVNMGSVRAFYRIPVFDDASAAYGIAITPGAVATLSSVTSPARIIVDIADTTP